MNLRKNKLPAAPKSRLDGVWCEVSESAFSKWDSTIHNAHDENQDGENTITILEFIGQGFFSEGVTAKRISAALRSIGSNADVTVYINSPGGDLFEGLAIYNLLREHKGQVTIKVLGLAASAAAFIAMAGDRVEIARSAFIMIHNTWVCACGDRNDFMDIAERLEPFDNSIADILATRSGLDSADVHAMMDKETFIGGSDAVEQGFADALLAADEVEKDKNQDPANMATQQIDVILAATGMPRSRRRELIKNLKGSKPSADPKNPQDMLGADPDGADGMLSAADLEQLSTGFESIETRANNLLESIS